MLEFKDTACEAARLFIAQIKSCRSKRMYEMANSIERRLRAHSDNCPVCLPELQAELEKHVQACRKPGWIERSAR
jgi:DNA repair exonuclease SbcCD ATPase subunit